ncbi:hypothetical protein [Caulobacter sp. Root487D2Y]|jgi:hypothetical protein|uniref:hypothetical protein n=1 Tax=Caulobacter sp. Root487D2Y TaxID=1736547 RepID=UPI000A3E5778|nr:hypothetical protein [Caulobacter sp. Root487D2Y]
MDADVTPLLTVTGLCLCLCGAILALQTFSLIERRRARVREASDRQAAFRENQDLLAERFRAEGRRAESDRAEMLERLDRLEASWRAASDDLRAGLEPLVRADDLRAGLEPLARADELRAGLEAAAERDTATRAGLAGLIETLRGDETAWRGAHDELLTRLAAQDLRGGEDRAAVLARVDALDSARAANHENFLTRLDALRDRIDDDRKAVLNRLDQDDVARQASLVESRAARQALQGGLRRIEALQVIPAVQHLKIEQIGGQAVKVMDQQLDFGVDILRAVDLSHAHRGWKPSKDGRPPYPVFAPGAEVGQTIFSTHALAINCAVLADLININGAAPYKATLDALVADITRNSDPAAVGGRKIRLDYDHSLLGATIPAGWASASAQAEAALGVLQLAQAKAMPEPYRALARELITPLIAGDEDLVRRDAGGYLWLEDMPPIHGKPLQSLHGHLLATLAVYRYVQCTDDRAAEPVLRACLATAARYLPETRRPGETPIFSLAYPETGTPQGMALRALVIDLGLISRHPIFDSIASAFASDVPPAS